MITLLLFLMIFGTSSTHFVVAPATPATQRDGPTTFPETLEQAENAIGWAGAACLSGDLANLMAKLDRGVQPTDAEWEGRRAYAAEIALRSNWSLTEIVTQAIAQSGPARQSWHHVQIAQSQGDEPDETMVGALLQHQSDCQDYHRARNQHRQLSEQRALDNISNIEGLLSCAALFEALNTRHTDTSMANHAEALRQLSIATGQILDPPVEITPNPNHHTAFFEDFVRTDMMADGSPSENLQRYITHCDELVEALTESGFLD